MKIDLTLKKIFGKWIRLPKVVLYLSWNDVWRMCFFIGYLSDKNF